ncbi:MAG: PfkB family carbohydrate kinase, partial [Nanoarchaeota archaeon]
MSLLASFRNPVKPILVVGDVMLDRFNYGVLADHNPESDADSFNINKVEYRAGGAANVALNLRALGAPVILGGIVGNDSEGSQLQALLQQHDVQTLFTSDGRQTTVKTRHIFEKTGQHKLRS